MNDDIFAAPSSLDTIISRAAAKYKIDPAVLRAVGEQETGLGKSSVYDPARGVSRTPGNAGHGIWQLDPASGASQADLSRAASDPAFAADYAARMLANNYRASKGDWTAALAAYNAGTAASKVGLSYAQQVLARIPHGDQLAHRLPRIQGHLELTDDRVSSGLPPPRHSLLQKLSDRVPDDIFTPSPDDIFAHRNRATTPPAPRKLTDPNYAGMTPDEIAIHKRLVKAADYMESVQDVTSTQGPAGLSPFASSALSEIAGHQDLPFILMNAQERDIASGRQQSIIELLKDPHSTTAQAWALYKSDPAKAMDAYGMGSPQQNAWMAQHAKDPASRKFARFLVDHPYANGALTALVEGFNPMAALEGLGAGKALGFAARLAGPARVLRAGQVLGRATGFSSPLAALEMRAGVEGSQWGKSLIASVAAPHKLLHLPATDKIFQEIFGGLTPEEQEAVVTLSHPEGQQHLDPKFLPESGDLQRRADRLRADIKAVTAQQVRVKRLTPSKTLKKGPRAGTVIPGTVHNPETFFPMSGSYDFGEPATLEQELRGEAPAGRGSVHKPKTYTSMWEARASGDLAPDFLAATNFVNWREPRLQQVAFEDALNRAPRSLRLPPKRGLKESVLSNEGMVGDLKYVIANAPQKIPSPALRSGAMAPELAHFLSDSSGLRRYLGSGTVHLGSEGSWFGAKWLTLARNMIVSNFFYHPVLNVAPREAASRTLHDLGGARWEVGGPIYNMAKAAALQAGVNPERFIGGAQNYSHWLDRALVAGAAEELGMPRTSARGLDRARVLSVPDKSIMARFDRAFTKAGDFNRERTFGSRGAEAFALSLFKDAVQSGLSDARAARITSEAIGDLYNFDPQSKLSSFLFFMPWRKGNMKFWTNVLAKKPAVLTAPAHAIRNINEQTAPADMQGPYSHPDFQLQNVPLLGSLSLPFVGRDEGRIANVGGSILGRQGVAPVISEAQPLLTGSANPLTRGGLDTASTIQASFSSEVEGPETNFNLIVNPKAPPDVQYQQVARYFLARIPVPLIGFSLQRAAQKGVAPKDAFAALASAVGLGFPGGDRLTDDQRRELSKAKARYKKAWQQYTYGTHDSKALNSAWDGYIGELKQIGVVH